MKMKRFLTMFLVVTLLFGALPNMGALKEVFAADGGQVSGNNEILEGTSISTIYGSAVKGSDGKVYTEGSFTAVNYENGSYTTDKTNSFDCKELIGVEGSNKGSWLYCVEYNTKFSRDGYTSTNVNNSKYLRFNDGTLVQGLNKLAKDKGISGLNGNMSVQYILIATIYGWQPDATMPTELKNQGLNDWDWYFGTQVVIWEFQQGIRQSPTQRNGNGYNSGTAIYNWLKGRPAEYAYNYVLNMMAQHYTVPSFTKRVQEQAPTYTLKWNSTNRRYELTLPDTAGYAFNLKFSDSDIKCTKSGSNFTIYTTKTITSAVTQKTQKNMNIADDQKLLVWGKSGKQTMISGMQDPVEFYMKIQTELPTITIKKTGDTSADIANKLFYVYKDGSSTACRTLTTDASGNAKGTLPGDGSYRIVEQNASKYNVTYTINGTSTQTFTYPSARDANNNVTVNVNNEEKPGYFQLKKESEDGKVSGIRFSIANAAGQTVATGTTNADGYLEVNGSTNIALKPGKYTVTEINPPVRYEPLEPFTINVETGKTVTKTVKNTLVTSHLKIVKTSEDDVVAGIQFRVRGTTAKGKSVDMTVVTGSDGTIAMDMEQGTYTVSEINVPSKYYVPTSQSVVLNDADGEVVAFYNEIKPGKLQILKQSEDGIVDGLKFRVTGDGVDITGFTNEDGYVEFGKKAYIVEGRTSYGNKFAVVTKDATWREILSDLGLDINAYRLDTASSAYLSDPELVISSYFSETRNFASNSGNPHIETNSGTPYAQVVFLGSVYGGANTTNSDYYAVPSMIGEQMGEDTPNNAKVAAYDIDRDGIVTQADVDVIQGTYSQRTYVKAGSTILDVKAGTYQITELDVPDRYTAGFDQEVTVNPSENGEVTKITVTNYLKDSGIKIVKKSDDGIIQGIQFRIKGTTTAGKSVNMIVTTDENGMVVQKLDNGTYTISEINVPDRYIAPESQTVTISGQDYIEVTFVNETDDGEIEIIKKSEDGTVAGFYFTVQSISTSTGKVISRRVRTTTNGIIVTSVPAGTYIVSEVNVPAQYKIPEPQIVTVEAGERASVTFENFLEIPHLEIVKTSEDGIIEGVTFTVTGTTLTGNAYSETFTTDANGLISADIPQGDYTVTEMVDPRYEAQAPQTVSLRNDESKKLSFANVLVTGKLEIKKTSEDGNISNIPFHISGLGADGIEVDLTLKTNVDGVITTQLKPGTYTVTELLEDAKYIIQEPQTVTVTYGQTATVTFKNVVKKFQLSLTKTDGSTEIGIPQQEGAMEGAVYGLYKADGTLIKEYTTDKDGKIETDVIPCEAAYVQEITAPKGYTLDENQYWLASSVDECYLEVTNLSLDVVDYPIMGSINILKRKGLEDKWEYEEGAVFQVYLKSAGSYEAANEWERDQITTDAAYSAEESNTGEAHLGGEAGTKDLPLGTYIVHQVSGAEGYLLAQDMEVEITEENTVISLEILNEAQEEFPFTGGSGITPYVVGSIIVMLMALVVAACAPKRSCGI